MYYGNLLCVFIKASRGAYGKLSEKRGRAEDSFVRPAGERAVDKEITKFYLPEFGC